MRADRRDVESAACGTRASRLQCGGGLRRSSGDTFHARREPGRIFAEGGGDRVRGDANRRGRKPVFRWPRPLDRRRSAGEARRGGRGGAEAGDRFWTAVGCRCSSRGRAEPAARGAWLDGAIGVRRGRRANARACSERTAAAGRCLGGSEEQPCRDGADSRASAGRTTRGCPSAWCVTGAGFAPRRVGACGRAGADSGAAQCGPGPVRSCRQGCGWKSGPTGWHRAIHRGVHVSVEGRRHSGKLCRQLRSGGKAGRIRARSEGGAKVSRC